MVVIVIGLGRARGAGTGPLTFASAECARARSAKEAGGPVAPGEERGCGKFRAAVGRHRW